MRPVIEAGAVEVMAHYGKIMLLCQTMEKGLATLLSTVHGVGPREGTREEVEALFGEMSSKTLGTLIALYRKTGAVPQSINPRLNEALRLRNRLAHQFWWDNVEKLYTAHGQQEMRVELDGIEEYIASIEEDLRAVWRGWLDENGIREHIERNTRDTLDRLGAYE